MNNYKNLANLFLHSNFINISYILLALATNPIPATSAIILPLPVKMGLPPPARDGSSRQWGKGNPFGWKGLDQVRQNKFNDALFKFGWRDMLSWEFDNEKILNHSRQFKGHFNHLHLQDYNLNILKIKNL